MSADHNVQNLDKAERPVTGLDTRKAEQSEPDTDWSDEELKHCCFAAEFEGKHAETNGLSLLRRSLAARWRGCKAASILRQRYKSERAWCKAIKDAKLPRSTLTEMAEIYDRATAQGHCHVEIFNHRTWTEVKIAYGVVKERVKKQAVSAACDVGKKDVAKRTTHADPAAQSDGTASATEPTTTDAGVDSSQAVSKIEGSAPPETAVEVNEEPSGPADADILKPQQGQQPRPEATNAANPDDKKARPVARAKKTDNKDQGDLSPCEIDAGNALLVAAGSWDRAMHVLETLKNVAGG